MAVTKIWAIKRSVADPIKYIENEEKTINPIFAEGADTTSLVLDYATNGDKTLKKHYVSGVNCNKDFATEEFLMTKKRFGKEDGNVLYHGYQSFDKEEVTAEQAHEIGVALAEKMWGDRFQVVVATHTNTEHVHNHFIINSVSFKDGNKLHDSKRHYDKMRRESDRLCREHNLSVIENPKGKAKSHYEWMMDQAGMPTRASVIRDAIDYALSVSVNFEEFKAELKNMGYGYQFNPKRKYWTVTLPGWNKPYRLHHLGSDYTNERIMERLYANEPSVREYKHRPNGYRLPKRIDKINRRKSGLERMYLRCCYEMGYLPKVVQRPERVHRLFKDELLMCDKYSKEAQILGDNKIVTDKDLYAHINYLDGRMYSLGAERDELRKLVKRSIPEDAREDARERITGLTDKIKELRSERKLCEDIRDRSGLLEEKLQAIDKERLKGKEVRNR